MSPRTAQDVVFAAAVTVCGMLAVLIVSVLALVVPPARAVPVLLWSGWAGLAAVPVLGFAWWLPSRSGS